MAIDHLKKQRNLLKQHERKTLEAHTQIDELETALVRMQSDNERLELEREKLATELSAKAARASESETELEYQKRKLQRMQAVESEHRSAFTQVEALPTANRRIYTRMEHGALL